LDGEGSPGALAKLSGFPSIPLDVAIMAKTSRRNVSRRSATYRPESSRPRAFVLRPGVEDLEVRRLLAVTINEFGGSTQVDMTAGITKGPDGNLWFTEVGSFSDLTGSIDKVTPSGAITRFTTGLSQAGVPTGITTGPDGALWFTEFGGIAEGLPFGNSAIGRIDPVTGQITEYTTGLTANSGPSEITTGSDGALWFTEKVGNQIGRIDPTTGQITEYKMGLTANSQPVGITAGPDGDLWFAESNTDLIGRIDPNTAQITEFGAGIIPHNSAPTGITVGPDGALWFTEIGSASNPAGGIGRITVQGAITQYTTGLTPGSGPAGIASGPNGSLYFTEESSGFIGQITTQGAISEFNQNPPTSEPADITLGPDNNLWFTELSGTHVDRISPTGTLTQFPSSTNVITTEAGLTGITAGPDNALWFTEISADKIGRISTAGAITEYPVSSGANPTAITLGPVPVTGGSPNLWFIEQGTDDIGEITSGGVLVNEFPIGVPNTVPEDITLGSDGNLWFTLQDTDGGYPQASMIARITPTGTVTPFPVFPLYSQTLPDAIVTGPNGNLWFTAKTATGGEIGEITTAGALMAEYPIPNNTSAGYTSSPTGITKGLNNDLWFTDPGNHAIGEITATGPNAGQITEFSTGLNANDSPNQIATGADGNYWFTDPNSMVDSIGQITPAGNITLFPTPTEPSTPLGITAGPDNNLWFVENLANQVGQVVIPQSITNLTGLPASVVATVPSSFPIATFTDNSAATNASNFVATIDYGDGTSGPGTIVPLATPGDYEVMGMHTYAVIGTLGATITIGTTTGSVAPVFPSVTATTPQILTGLTIDGISGRRSNTLVGTFIDLDTTSQAADFTATVTWSDNTISTANLELLSSTSTSVIFNVYAGHTFATSGNFVNFFVIYDNRNNINTDASFPSQIAPPAPFTPFNEVGPDQLSPGAAPNGIALGSDNALWFTETNTGNIGRVDTSGNVTEYVPPAPSFSGIPSNPMPTGITSGPDGNLWFTDSGTDDIGQITTGGVFTFFSANITPGAAPDSITSGPAGDNDLWFTEVNGNRIGRITTNGVITEFSMGLTPGFDPDSITLGPDGNLWFVGLGSSMIGEITPLGVITEHPGATFTDITSITVGPDKNLWFTEQSGNTIGTINPTTFVVTENRDPNTSDPTQIVTGPDGNLYFTGSVASDISEPQVDQITTDGVVTPFSTGLTLNSALLGITNGPDGNLYFTESLGDRIGQVVLPQTSLSPPLAFGPTAVPINFSTNFTLSGLRYSSTIATTANYQVMINWGDGTTTPGVIALDSSDGAANITGTHTYSKTGDFPLTVSVFNAVNAFLITSYSVDVPSGASISAFGSAFVTTENREVSPIVATFFDSTPNTTPSNYTATINWGDGTVPTVGVISLSSPGFEVTGTHVFTGVGLFTVTVVITNTTTNETATAVGSANVSASGVLSFVVANANDSGPGSLRQAILNADTIAGKTITFAIPSSGVVTIALLSPLPAIAVPTIIDGTSEAKSQGSSKLSPLIEIDGRRVGGTSPGLLFAQNASGSIVKDLSIFGFAGPEVEFDSGKDLIEGSYVGLRADGSIPASLPNSGPELSAEATVTTTPSHNGVGVLVFGPGVTIGGLAAGQANVISGNDGFGIELSGSQATSDLVLGNLIGLDPTGSSARPNATDGITVIYGAGHETIGPKNVISGNGQIGIDLAGSSSNAIFGNDVGLNVSGSKAIPNGTTGICVDGGSNDNTIGATVAGSANVISGNLLTGITIQAGSSQNTVAGNLIGTNLAGSKAIGNGIAGILISDAPGNTVGPGDVVSGNGTVSDGAGIWIEGPTATGNQVFGDMIGTDKTGEAALGNAIIGLLINDAPNNTIGGTTPNVISGNTQIGVMIAGTGSTGNLVMGNMIGTNTEGTKAIGNGSSTVGAGVYIDDAPGNSIGGSAAGMGNLISGNGFDGVQVFGPSSTGNLFQGNKIGTDATGTRALGNGNDGLVVNGASGTQIVSNVIAANAGNGITITDTGTSGTLIQSNLIGQGVSGQQLGNGAYGILIVNGAAMPTGTGNTDLYNALGPIRDTGVAPPSSLTSSSVSASKVGHVSAKKAKAKPKPATHPKAKPHVVVHPKATPHVAVHSKATPKVTIHPKATSFHARPMPKLQHSRSVSHKK
jgi:streptogramin lyase